MSIRHAILGLLAEQPMHGYRLKEAFDRRVSPLWGLTTGQIYQSLAALERSALVESRSERKGRRPARRVYSVTESGKRDLTAWLRDSPAAWARPFREEILIRLMMLREDQAPELWRTLGRQEAEAMALLMRVTRMCDEQPRTEGGINLSQLFLDSLAQHLEADIRNLQRFRAEIERWGQDNGVDVKGSPADSIAAARHPRSSVDPARSAPGPATATARQRVAV